MKKALLVALTLCFIVGMSFASTNGAAGTAGPSIVSGSTNSLIPVIPPPPPPKK